ncbi:MAG: ATP-binding cassette domain-containing protein [Caldilineaceae bacterium]
MRACALQEVDLTIAQGKIHCLVGENGCGKSTLIKIIAGVYERDAGTVTINGQPIGRIQPIDAIRRVFRLFIRTFPSFPI